MHTDKFITTAACLGAIFAMLGGLAAAFHIQTSMVLLTIGVACAVAMMAGIIRAVWR